MIEVNNSSASINFSPNLAEEITQNVRTIINTVKGSVPFDKSFGLDSSSLDEPTLIAQARLTGMITTAIQTYEPRASVVQVLYESDDQNGILQPIVQIEIVEEVDG